MKADIATGDVKRAARAATKVGHCQAIIKGRKPGAKASGFLLWVKSWCRPASLSQLYFSHIGLEGRACKFHVAVWHGALDFDDELSTQRGDQLET